MRTFIEFFTGHPFRQEWRAKNPNKAFQDDKDVGRVAINYLEYEAIQLDAKIDGMMMAAEIKICGEEHLSPIGLAMECLTEYRQAILTAIEKLRKETK